MAGVQPSKFINYISQFKKIFVTRNNGAISQKFKIDSNITDDYYFQIVNSNQKIVSLAGRQFKIYGSIEDAKNNTHILFFEDRATVDTTSNTFYFNINTYTSEYLKYVTYDRQINITIVETYQIPSEDPNVDPQEITQVVLRDIALAYKRPYVDGQQVKDIFYREILTGTVPWVGEFGAGQDITLTYGSNGAAFGTGLQQTGNNQLVIGKFNEVDNTKAFIIGNGEDGDPNNVFTVDYLGNVEANTISASTIAIGGSTVATEQSVDNKLTSTSGWVNDTFETKSASTSAYNSLAEDIGDVDTKVGNLSATVVGNYATKTELGAVVDAIPTKTSQLTNDSGYITEHQSLSAYALQSDLALTAAVLGNQIATINIPTKTSDLTNDSHFITGYTAGTGIKIENGEISVSGEMGKTYTADDVTLQLSNSNQFSIKSIASKLNQGQNVILTPETDGSVTINAIGGGGGGTGGATYLAGLGLGLSTVSLEDSIYKFYVNQSWLDGKITSATSGIQNLSAGTGLKIEDNIISLTATIPDNVVTEDELSGYALKSELETVSGIATGNATDIGTLSTDLATVSGKVDTNEGNISTLSTDLGTANTNIGTISGNLDSVSADVATNTANIGTLSTAVEIATGDVTSLIADIETVSGIATTNETNIGTLSTDLGTVTTDVGTISGNLTTVSGKVDTNEGNITTLSTDLGTANTNIGTLSTDLGTVSGTASTNSTNISTISGDLSTVSDKVDTNTSNIETLSTTVETATGDITSLVSDVETVSGIATGNSTDIGTLSSSLNTANDNIGTLSTNLGTVSGKADTNADNISTLSTDLGTVSSNLDSVSATVGTNTTDIGTLSTDLGTANENITTLSTNLGTVSGKADTNAENITSLSTTVGTATGNITDLRTDVDAVSGIATTNTTNISTVSGNLNDLTTGAVATNTANIGTLSTNLGTVSGKADTNADNISTLSTDLGTANTNIGTLSTGLGTANENIGTISSNLGTVSGKADTNAENITTLSTDLGTANTNIGTLSTGLNTANENIGTLSTNLGTVSGKADTNAENIGTLSTDLGTANGNISTISSNLGTVSGKVDTNIDNIGTISSNLGTVSSNLATVSGKVDTNEGNISTLSTDLGTANGNISTISSNLATVSGKADTNASNISTLSTNLGTVSSNLETVSGKVETNITNIGTLSTNLATVSGKADTNAANITTLSTDLGTANSNISTLSTNLGTVSSDLNTAKGNISTLSANLATVSGKVETNIENIGTLSTNLGTVSANLATVSGKVETNTTNISTISGNLNTVSANLATVSGDVEVIKADYVTSGVLTSYVNGHFVKISQLANDVGYITLADIPGGGSGEPVYYTAGDGLTLNGTQFSLTGTVLSGDGTTVQIVDNVISAIGGGTTYTAGTGIDITNDVISVSAEWLTSQITNTVTSSYISGLGFALTSDIPSIEGLISASQASAIASAVTTGYLTGYTTSAQVSSIVEGYGYITGIANNALLSDIKTYTAGEGLKLEGTEFSLTASIPTGLASWDAATNSGYVREQGFALTSEIPLSTATSAQVSSIVESYGYTTGYTAASPLSISSQNEISLSPQEIRTSQLYNDEGFITNSALEDYYTKTEADAAFLSTSTVIPLSTSQLTNDSEFATSANVSSIVTSYGYITGYTAGTGIDINNGVISCTVQGGSDLSTVYDMLSAGPNINLSKDDQTGITTISAAAGGGSTNLIAGNRIRLTETAQGTRIDVLDYTISAANTASFDFDWRLAPQTSSILYSYEGFQPVTVSFNPALPNGIAATVDSATSSVVFTTTSGATVSNGTSVVSATIIASDAQEAVVQTTINTIGFNAAIIVGNDQTFNFNFQDQSSYTGEFDYEYVNGTASASLSTSVTGLPEGIQVSNSFDGVSGTISFTCTNSSNVPNGTYVGTIKIIANDTIETVFTVTINVSGIEDLSKPLTFKAVNGPATIKLNKKGSNIDFPFNPVLSASYNNGESWSSYSVGNNITLNQGDTVMLSGTNNEFSKTQNYNFYFTMTGSVEADGNIQSLMNYSNSCTDYCYNNMFSGCTSLLTAPQLPATTIATECYYNMFNGCTSLTAAPPKLPATTMAYACYKGMFWNCTSLSTAPALPATGLASECYALMFEGCTNLRNAPTIYGTTLIDYCCWRMFQNCTNLSSITVHFTGWVNNTTINWVNGVASNGTFTCPQGLTDTRGVNNIPTNWTKVDLT